MKRWMLTATLMAFFSTWAIFPARCADRLALLIAAARCKDPLVSVLDPGGDQVDTLTLRDALKKKGFDSAGITELVEAKATKEKILAAMDDLAKRAQSGDAVVFYFSGHGGRVKGHLALCPYDATAESATNDISDEELYTWVEKLRTRNVTIILDCCFSASGAKGMRKLPKVILRNLDTIPARPIRFPQDRTLILQAANDGEEAQQFEVAPRQWVGVFTYWLSRELDRANPETTYRQLMQRVNQSVNRFITRAYHDDPFNQNPTIRGADDQQDRPLFTSPQQMPNPPAAPNPPVAPYVVVHEVARGKIVLDRGQTAGLMVGSQYAVYKSGEKTFSSESALGSIEIVQMTPDTATAKIIEERTAGSIQKGCRAVETKHAAPIATNAKVRVRVEAPGASGKAIRQGLGTLDFVEMGGDAPDLVLKVVEQGGGLLGKLYASHGKTPKRTPPDDKKPEGKPIEFSATNPEELVTQFSPLLENFFVLRGLTSLKNPNPAFTIDLHTDKQVYHLQDALQATLMVNAKQDYYLALVHVDANGQPNVIFPINGSDNLIHGGTEYVIPSPALGLGTTFRIKPPKGRETIVAIVTREQIDWRKATRSSLEGKLPTLIAKGIDVEIGHIQNSPLSEWETALVNIIIE